MCDRKREREREREGGREEERERDAIDWLVGNVCTSEPGRNY